MSDTQMTEGLGAKDQAGRRWGMTVDVNRCVGCQTCTVACKHANDTVPHVQWRKVLDVETGKYPDVERLFLVVGCQHCAEPPCVPVCPTGATAQRADGLVTMDYDLCIGCASCAVACPYQARTLVHDKEWYYGTETVQERYVDHPERMGVAQKCTFCITRVDDGLEAGLTPGVDPDATPACAAACIADAITFGDFNDPESQVSRLVREKSSFQMHAELGTDPQIKYLYETPAVPGREPEAADLDDEAWSDPANPLVGERQTFWDMRAAMNFIMGGIGSGFVLAVYLASFYSSLDDFAVTTLYTGAGAIIAIGLFFVWLKIGRKLRAPLVLLKPGTSWMSREVYAVGLFYVALIADWVWPGAVMHLIVALTALVFLYCQVRILHVSKGIPSWRVPVIPPLLYASGLLEGAGLLIVVFAFADMPAIGMTGPLVWAAILTVITATLWAAYRRNGRAWGIGPLSDAILDKITPWLAGFGYAVPFALFVLALIWPPTPLALSGLGGLAALAGGVLWKSTVITRACHQQGFALAKFPQRGSGRFSAPSVLDRAAAE